MMRLTTRLVVLGFVFVATPADAQQTDFSGMNVKGAPRVIVTDRSGDETTGRLVSWTESSVVLDTNGAKRTYSPGEAVRIDLRGDSLKNGIIIGAAFGLLGGLIGDCPDAGRTGRSSDGCPGARTVYFLGGAATWAAIGAGIDALIPGRTPLWNAGPSQKSGALILHLSPQRSSAFVGWSLRV